MVAALRDIDLHVAVRDVYAFPTPRRLAEHLAAASALQAEAAPAEVESTAPVPTPQGRVARRRAPGAPFRDRLVLTTPSFFVVPIADDLLRGRLSIAQTVLIMVAFYLALTPVMMAIGIGAKWLIIGRYKPGASPLWGGHHIRWWLVSGLQQLFGGGIFSERP